MPYLLDTNICIYIIKKTPITILDKFNAIAPAEIAVSTITVAELEYGARKSSFPEKNLALFHKFLQPFTILPFDTKASIEYGIVRAALEVKGIPIGPLDTLIAAHAKCMYYTLVTNNTKEFERVDGLKIENWV